MNNKLIKLHLKEIWGQLQRTKYTVTESANISLKYCHVTNYPKKRKEDEHMNDMNYRSININSNIANKF